MHTSGMGPDSAKGTDMKLGSETGSLVNHVMSESNPDKPEVGMGATILMWTDRAAGTIIEVSKSGKTIKVQRDHAKRIDDLGMTDSGQKYEFSRNPNGSIYTFRFGKRGWRGTGGSPGLLIGHRSEHYDFSF